jgi:hypothetical protein
MVRTETVKFFLGEKQDRYFSVEVTGYYDKPDYDSPTEVEFEISSDYYDEDYECICNDLIKRYEAITKVDIESLVIDEFQQL